MATLYSPYNSYNLHRELREIFFWNEETHESFMNSPKKLKLDKMNTEPHEYYYMMLYIAREWQQQEFFVNIAPKAMKRLDEIIEEDK
jgi:hypothetical protein